MKLQSILKEILFLTTFFTAIALYLDIHKEHCVLIFCINHIVSLLLALIFSTLIFKYMINRKS
jgi:hypothetical protein